MTPFPYRQIHLDFHTPGALREVGSAFDPEEFARRLEQARVDSVTCFARCHHGWLYYDSKAFPEQIHPGLTRPDLLERQIAACRRRGIRVPVYTTVQWDGRLSSRYPEYCVIAPEGQIDGYRPHEAGFYAFLCVNSPYREFLKDHLAELLSQLEPEGLFLDILQVRDCSCRFCLEGMKEQELDPHRKEHRLRYAEGMIREFRREIAAFVESRRPGCALFFNGSHIGPRIRPSLESYSHLEVESLPSGGWGYSHFPLTARYARGLGKAFCGMTGKFHTHWGDFHSYKNPAALAYECFSMLALGGGCSVGDQLLPSGRLEEAAYDLIGLVYASVEEKEPWCRGARPLADIGLFNLEEWEEGQLPDPMVGALRLLEQIGAQFDLIDSRSDWSPYKLLILPDRVPLDTAGAEKMRTYLARGGALLASFASGLTPSGEAFALEDLFGLTLEEDDLRDAEGEKAAGKYYFLNDYCDFIRPEGPIGRGLPPTEHALYIRGLQTALLDEETRLLAPTLVPPFFRTAAQFCSHQQTPSSGREGAPGIVQKGRVLYFSHPVFTIYKKKGPRWVKTLVRNAVEELIEPRLTHQGPSTLKALVNSQDARERWVLHFLHYISEKRCDQIELIEDVIPLYGVPVSLLAEKDPREIRTVPEGRPLTYSREGGRIAFTLPEIRGHLMVEVAF